MRVSLVSLTSVVKKAVRSLTRAACCMLWVTITIVYSVLISCIRSSMRAVAIGSRAEHGSSIRIDLGLDGDGPGDAEALLLAAGQAHGRLLEPVLDLVPQRGPAQGPLDDVVEVALRCPASFGPKATLS